MTERIDHAASAGERLSDGGELVGVDEFAYAEIAFKAAQVHATLALVEQQRIANLIAAFQMEGGPYKEANNWVADEYGDAEEDANVRLRREIREGLGLV